VKEVEEVKKVKEVEEKAGENSGRDEV